MKKTEQTKQTGQTEQREQTGQTEQTGQREQTGQTEQTGQREQTGQTGQTEQRENKEKQKQKKAAQECLPKWIDVHTHLDMLKGDPKTFVERAREKGVDRMVTIGTESSPEAQEKILKLAKTFYPHVFCTLGVHPQQSAHYNEETESLLYKLGREREVVALGEMGLDYHYEEPAPSIQKKAFLSQMELAEKLGLPVEIHTREAEQDTLEILQEFKGRVRGLIHCFTSSYDFAKKYLNLGYHFSINGILTFKKAQSLRDVVSKIPLDHLHLETDAPFLAPVPFRGKENEPAYVVHTAEVLRQIHVRGLDEKNINTDTSVDASARDTSARDASADTDTNKKARALSLQLEKNFYHLFPKALPKQ